MTAPAVTRISAHQLQVSGVIDFAHALNLCQQVEQLINQADAECEIDFSAVTRAGSVALTVMFSWLRHAVAQQKTLVFVELPADLLGVAKVSGVDAILPIK